VARDPFGLVGTTIDRRYRIRSVVGEGGFGVVYRAKHLAFGHDVAVKCLKIPSHFDDAAREVFLERFREEGRTLSKLAEHEGIVRVFDFGFVEARGEEVPYLALEWLEGEPLEAILRRRRAAKEGGLDLGLAFLVFEAAVKAVAFAHAEKIAHRDIKPANLFVVAGEELSVKILDFGIAKAVQDGDSSVHARSSTTSGFSAFSPLYGAPEQFSSKRWGSTGPWTDVHALGLVFVELVSGRMPYPGDDIGDLFLAATNPERPTPRSFGMEIPAELERVVEKAIALVPKDRYEDAGALLAAVYEIESAVPAPAGDLEIVPAPAPASLAFADTEINETPRGDAAPPLLRSTTAPLAGARRASGRSGVALIAGVAALLFAGGAGGYLWSRSSAAAKSEAGAGPTAAATLAPAPSVEEQRQVVVANKKANESKTADPPVQQAEHAPEPPAPPPQAVAPTERPVQAPAPPPRAPRPPPGNRLAGLRTKMAAGSITKSELKELAELCYRAGDSNCSSAAIARLTEREVSGREMPIQRGAQGGANRGKD